MPNIVIDFDHTLFDAQSFKKDLAKALGLTLKKWEAEYEKNKKQNKNYNYRKQLIHYAPAQKKKFLKVLNNCKKYLYKDALGFVKSIQKEPLQKVTILSKGHSSWQKIKIDNCGFPKNIQIKVVSGSKGNFIKKLLKEDQVIFINDRGTEIDEIKNNFSEVKAIWIARPNGQYKNEMCKKFNFKYNNLKINKKIYERI
ncbi:MAG: hypothetical protein V1898_02000 [Patescibacteria group bacterium]